jgi:hypothetical protein
VVEHDPSPVLFEAFPVPLMAMHPFVKLPHERRFSLAGVAGSSYVPPVLFDASPVTLNAPQLKSERLPHDPAPALFEASPVPFPSRSPTVTAMQRGTRPSNQNAPLQLALPTSFDALPAALAAMHGESPTPKNGPELHAPSVPVLDALPVRLAARIGPIKFAVGTGVPPTVAPLWSWVCASPVPLTAT